MVVHTTNQHTHTLTHVIHHVPPQPNTNTPSKMAEDEDIDALVGDRDIFPVRLQYRQPGIMVGMEQRKSSSFVPSLRLPPNRISFDFYCMVARMYCSGRLGIGLKSTLGKAYCLGFGLRSAPPRLHLISFRQNKTTLTMTLTVLLLLLSLFLSLYLYLRCLHRNSDLFCRQRRPSGPGWSQIVVVGRRRQWLVHPVRQSWGTVKCYQRHGVDSSHASLLG